MDWITNAQWVTAVALGIGLSAAAGFRVFIPLLVASVAAHFGWLPVQAGFAWLAGWPAMIAFSTAAVIEIMAYYIPFVDNLLDTITTPLAMIAGTLLMTSVLPVDHDLLKWVTGIMAGGGMAGIIQGGSVLTRLASSKFTAGTGNAVVATGEQVASLGTSVFALILPIVTALIFIVLAIVIIRRLVRKFLKRA